MAKSLFIILLLFSSVAFGKDCSIEMGRYVGVFQDLAAPKDLLKTKITITRDGVLKLDNGRAIDLTWNKEGFWHADQNGVIIKVVLEVVGSMVILKVEAKKGEEMALDAHVYLEDVKLRK